MFAVGILKLAGDIGFEPMMTISKTVALGQARRIPNKLLNTLRAATTCSQAYFHLRMYIKTHYTGLRPEAL